MSFANIVVDASPNSGVRRTLEAARDISAEFGSKLTVASYAWPRTSLLRDAIGSNIMSVEWQTQKMEEALEKTRGIYEEVMQGSEVDSDWCSGIMEPGNILRDHLFISDLAITGTGDAEAFIDSDPTDLAQRSGAPVLRIGQKAADWRFEQVLVAWKDSREARHAIHAALPILQRAKSVLIVGVGDKVTADRLEAVSRHMRGHRVAARHLHLSRDTESVCAQLLSRAEVEGCDLIVSGAYSRSRQSERIFGGVTRGILAADQMSWLFAH